jgi:hypothetical protein
MNNVEPKIKTCVNCKHLKILGTGREFEKIVDTEYTDFKCEILGWQKKEFYLMAVPGDIMEEAKKYLPCEFWEQWCPEA